MEITSNIPSRLLYIPQISNIGLKNLKPGDKLLGKVVDYQGGRVQVKIGDDQLNASTKLLLKKGSNIILQFDSYSSKGDLIFKVLPKGDDEGLDASEPIKAFLKELSLSDNPKMIEIVKGFISYGLPLNKELIMSFNRLLPGDTKELQTKLTNLVFLFNRGLTLNRENFEFITSILKGNDLIAFKNLKINFNKIEEQELVKSLFESINNVMKGFLINGESIKSSDIVQITTGKEKTLFELLIALNHLDEEISKNPELKSTLNLAGANIKDIKGSMLTLIKETIGEKLISKDITENVVFFHLPISFGEAINEVQTRISSNKRRMVEDESYRIDLKVETARLGLIGVSIDLNPANKKSKILFITEDIKIEEAIKDELYKLSDSIKTLGYNSFTLNVTSEAVALFTIQDFIQDRMVNYINERIDIKV
jgi:hypothetical protein